VNKKVSIKIRIASKVYVYLRVSSGEQVSDGYGLDSQLRACREFCDKRGWTIVEVFSDPGVSGWVEVERPGFRKMMAAIQTNRHVNLVFYDYSRFGRDSERALLAFKKLDRLGILTVAVTNPGIDCTTAAGRTSRRDELSRAEDFSDQHSEKQQARMKAAFEDGRWCNLAPLGYRNVGTKLKGHPNIVPFEPEANWIRKAFELVHTGNDRPAKVLREITDLGLRSKKGKKLTVSTFLETLRNPVYIGQMRSKKHGIGKGLHEPLVSEPIFRKVQHILKGDKPTAAPYLLNRPDFPLRQFLRCSECNRALTGGPSRSHTGKTYDYYHCYKCRAVKSLPTKKWLASFLNC
jgi:site-specific DNA recombinase